MIEIQIMIWSMMCLLFVTFCLTYRAIMSRNLTWDFIPLSHRDYMIKRALFISYTSLFEVMFALMINLEVAVTVHFTDVQTPTQTHNWLLAFDAASARYVSDAMCVCIFLSVCRCLVQRYTLGSLSKSDIVSMTYVYLVPSTCVLAVVSAFSWFRLREKVEFRHQRIFEADWTRFHVCRAVFFFYFLVGLFFSSVYDFMEYRANRRKSAPIRCSAYTTLPLKIHLNGTSVNPQKTSAPFSSKDNCQLNYFENNEERRLALETPLNNPRSPSLNLGHRMKTSVPSPSGQLQQSSCTALLGNSSDSTRSYLCTEFCDFLHSFSRLYVSVVLYFSLLYGVYICLEHLNPIAAIDDLRSVLFTAVLVINGALRLVQVATSQCAFDDAMHRQNSIEDRLVV